LSVVKPGSEEWLKGGGIVITGDAIRLELKLGASAKLLEQLAFRKIAEAMVQRLEITTSEQELNEAMAAFYAERKLFDPSQILDWLRSMRIGEEAIREYVREALLFRRVRDKVIPDQAVHERFGLNPHLYARAEAEVFIFSSEGAAREFVLAVRENEIGPVHGARRWIARQEAPGEAGVLIFSAEPGDLAGPVEIGYQCYEVYRLLHRDKPTLDAHLQSTIRDELFGELLRAELARDPLTFIL